LMKKRSKPLFDGDSHQAYEGVEGLEDVESGAAETSTAQLHPMMKIIQIIAAIIVLTLLVVILNPLLGVGIVVTGTIVAFPAALLWAAALKKTGAFFQASRSYTLNQLPLMAEQFALFLSAGFFVTALNYSGYNQVVNDYFVDFHHWVGQDVFLVLLPLITMSFCFIGMHPITTMALLAESLDPVILGITPEQMAIALTGGSVLTFMIGPFSGTMSVLSSMVKENTFRMVSWNPIQAFVYYLIVVLALLLY
jgi:hypothetical protein